MPNKVFSVFWLKINVNLSNVADCLPDKQSILNAFQKLYSYSEDFQMILKNVINPYGEGGSAKKTKEILKKIPLEGILKKEFWEL